MGMMREQREDRVDSEESSHAMHPAVDFSTASTINSSLFKSHGSIEKRAKVFWISTRVRDRENFIRVSSETAIGQRNVT
jgi:hypothetical protein